MEEILNHSNWTVLDIQVNNERTIELSESTANEILRRVNNLAANLFQRGVNLRIGIVIPRSVNYLVSVLAVLHSGNIFVPLNPSWPAAYMQDVLASADLRLLLKDTATNEALEKNSEVMESIHSVADQIMVEETMQEQDTVSSLKRPIADYSYVMYSSGSTGKPEGICGTMQGILNRCIWMSQKYSLSSSDRIAFSTTTVFVDSMWQMFGPMLCEATIVILPAGLLSNPEHFWKVVAATKITHFVTVPSILRTLFSYLEIKNSFSLPLEFTSCLKMLMSSGEALSLHLAKLVRRYLPQHTTFLNLYGCTEVAADSTVFEIPFNLESVHCHLIPVGFPISKTCILLLTPNKTDPSQLNPVIPGSTGELYIAGDGLCHGYFNLTSSEKMLSFVEIPMHKVKSWVEEGGGIVSEDWDWQQRDLTFFRTRDLGFLSTQGIEFIGRCNDQVKIHGVFVDPLYVEETLRSYGGIKDVVVKYWCNKQHPQLTDGLAAYIIPTEHDNDLHSQIRLFLKRSLPVERRPKWLVSMSRFPSSESGKILRKLLVHPEDLPESKKVIREQNILSVFKQVLQRASMEPMDNFFAFGGDSISAFEAAEILEIDPMCIQLYPTTRQLTAYLNGTPLTQHTPICSIKDASNWTFEKVLNKTTPYFQLKCQKQEDHESEVRMFAASRERMDEEPPSKKQRIAEEVNETFKLPSMLKKWRTSQYPGTCCYIRSPVQGMRILSPSGVLISLGESPILTQSSFPDVITSVNELWSVPLDECVDGPLLHLTFHFSPQVDKDFSLVLASCHGGRVCCFDASDGYQYWSTKIKGRAELGVFVSNQFSLLVQSSKSTVWVLSLDDGDLLSRIETRGEIRTPVVMDPWHGFLWSASRTPDCILVFSNSTVLLEFPSIGPVASTLAFHDSLHLIIYTSLSGKVVATKQTLLSGKKIACKEEWVYDAVEPIFAPPCCYKDICLVCTVRGIVHAVNFTGHSLWIGNIECQVFSPISIVETEDTSWAVVSSRDGHLFFLDIKTGATCLTVALQCGSISCPPVVLSDPYLHKSTGMISLACMTSAGMLLVFSMILVASTPQDCVLHDLYALQSEVFSPLLLYKNRLLFGSRENKVHCYLFSVAKESIKKKV